MDLGHLVQLIGSGEEWVQTESGGLEELSAVTKLFAQLSVRHLLTAAGADGMHTLIRVTTKC